MAFGEYCSLMDAVFSSLTAQPCSEVSYSHSVNCAAITVVQATLYHIGLTLTLLSYSIVSRSRI